MGKDPPDDWDQLDLFGKTPTPPRNTDPETSVEAAASVNRFHARALHVWQLRLLEHLHDQPDLRIHETLWALYNEWRRHAPSMPRVSVSGFRTRLSELVRAGYVKDSGTRALMSTGRRAIVWEITTDGAAALRLIDKRRW